MSKYVFRTQYGISISNIFNKLSISNTYYDKDRVSIDVPVELFSHMCSITINSVLYGYFRLKKNKLKWLGSLEDLKAFVITEINEKTAENAAWRSPSGGTWQFDSEMLSVTWHSKSQNIYFKGEYGDDLTKRVHSYVNQSLVENDQPEGTVEDLTDYLKPSLKRNPKNIIIHIGTNALKRKRAKYIAKNIERLC